MHRHKDPTAIAYVREPAERRRWRVCNWLTGISILFVEFWAAGVGLYYRGPAIINLPF